MFFQMQKNLVEGASPYYKELYKRRFVNDINDKENAIPVSHTCRYVNKNIKC